MRACQSPCRSLPHWAPDTPHRCPRWVALRWNEEFLAGFLGTTLRVWGKSLNKLPNRLGFWGKFSSWKLRMPMICSIQQYWAHLHLWLEQSDPESAGASARSRGLGPRIGRPWRPSDCSSQKESACSPVVIQKKGLWWSMYVYVILVIVGNVWCNNMYIHVLWCCNDSRTLFSPRPGLSCSFNDIGVSRLHIQIIIDPANHVLADETHICRVLVDPFHVKTYWKNAFSNIWEIFSVFMNNVGPLHVGPTVGVTGQGSHFALAALRSKMRPCSANWHPKLMTRKTK